MHRLFAFFVVAMVAMLASPDAVAGPILRRTAGSWFWGPVELHTAASTATTIFFPLSDPMPAAGLTGARFSYQITSDSGECKLRAAVRYSDDGVNWDTQKEVNAEYADVNDEIIWGTGAYVNLLTLAGTPAKAWIQFGLETKPETAAIAACQGTLRVEPEQK